MNVRQFYWVHLYWVHLYWIHLYWIHLYWVSSVEQNLRSMEENRDFAHYAAQMDASMLEKMEKIYPWLLKHDGARVVDVGTGTGTLAAKIAEILPNVDLIGVDLSSDMLSIADKKYGAMKNVSFMKASAHLLPVSEVDVLIYSSIIHEINSYDDSGIEAVAESLKEAYRKLKPSGRIIIRDFMNPLDGDLSVVFSHAKSDISLGQSFSDFVSKFGKGVKGVELSADPFGPRYKTKLRWLYEYIFRKDYHNNWEAELEELYGFWTLDEAQNMLRRVGFKIIHSENIRNQWIIDNRLDGKIRIFDEGGNPLDFPDYQMILVAEKPSRHHHHQHH